jgi:hypothetical protein
VSKVIKTVNARVKSFGSWPRPRRRRTLLASTMALSLVTQNVAWATCSDGTQFPAGGFIVGLPPVQTAANWSPAIFTGTAGSLFIPDNSTREFNDPNGPPTGGGHNWVFDQGSALCKETDVGTKKATTSWAIPQVNPTRCVVLPIIKNGVVTNIGDIPFQGDAVTPTCDPTLLSTSTTPNPANTYLNQLGCSISHGQATDPATATSFLFVTGIKGGLFSVSLDNQINPVAGGEAGKIAGTQNYFSAIPEGQQLTSAAVSPDGELVIATSLKRGGGTGGFRLPLVWACFHPLGNPGSPDKPIKLKFFVPQSSTISCMSVGSHGLATDLTTSFGPDDQPYFGGQRVVTSFDPDPGGSSKSAWPKCIWKNDSLNTSLADAFTNQSSNGCGTAQANSGFTSDLITQPQALIRHGQYMYTGPVGGTVVQVKVTVDPSSGLSTYAFRPFLAGLSIVTGLGVAEDLHSLMVYSDPSALGLSGQEVVTKLPLCEDM